MAKDREKLNFIQDAGIVIESPDFMSDFTLFENLNIIKICPLKRLSSIWIFGFTFYDVSKYKNTKYKNLSLGTKQKMILIESFMTRPKVLILDECFRGLDEKICTKNKRLYKKL